MPDDAGEYYEPSEEEKREIEDMLNQEDEIRESKPRNRLTFIFENESHWEGWLKVNGIKW